MRKTAETRVQWILCTKTTKATTLSYALYYCYRIGDNDLQLLLTCKYNVMKNKINKWVLGEIEREIFQLYFHSKTNKTGSLLFEWLRKLGYARFFSFPKNADFILKREQKFFSSYEFINNFVLWYNFVTITVLMKHQFFLKKGLQLFCCTEGATHFYTYFLTYMYL